MVLFKRKNVEIPPPNLTAADPAQPVWVIPETLEYFVTYDEYLARLDFYEAKRFNCELSGASCLSFFEARARERQETQAVLEKFPAALRRPVLEAVHYSLNTRLDLLVDETYTWLRTRFFVDEIVVLKRRGSKQQFRVISVATDDSGPALEHASRFEEIIPLQDSDVSKPQGSNSEGAKFMNSTPQDPKHQEPRHQDSKSQNPKQLDKSNPQNSNNNDSENQDFKSPDSKPQDRAKSEEPAPLPKKVPEKYELQDVSGGEPFWAPAVDLTRSRSIVSKPALRAFVKHAATRGKWLGAPWIVRDEYVAQFGLATEPPPVVVRLMEMHRDEDGLTDEQLRRQQQASQQLVQQTLRGVTPTSRTGTRTPSLDPHSGHGSPLMSTFSVDLGHPSCDTGTASISAALPLSGSSAPGPHGGASYYPNYSSQNRYILKMLADVDGNPEYPEDDLFALAKEAGGVPLAAYVQGLVTQRPWPVWHEDERLIDLSASGKTGHLFEIWLFTQLYRGFLGLDSSLILTFDQFVDGLRAPEMSTEIVTLHKRILGLLVEPGTTELAVPLPAKPQEKTGKRPYKRRGRKPYKKRVKTEDDSNNELSEEDDKDEEDEKEDDDDEENEDDNEDENENEEEYDEENEEDDSGKEPSTVDSSSEMDVDEEEDTSWPARIGRGEFDNGLWQSIVADILENLLYVKDWHSDTRAVVEALRPADQPHTPVSVSNAYADLPLSLRVHALMMILRLVYQSKSFRAHLDTLHEEQTKFRKRPLARDLRLLKDDLRYAERLLAHLRARDYARANELTDKDKEKDKDKVKDAKDTKKGKKDKDFKLLKDQKKDVKEGDADGNSPADDAGDADAWEQRVTELRAQIADKTAESEQNSKGVARLDSQRIQLLGKDRFFNRYWYMDGTGVAPLDEESDSVKSYALGRLCVQGPSADDLDSCINSTEYAEKFLEYRRRIFEHVQQFKVDQARLTWEKIESQRQARRRADYASAKSVTPLSSSSGGSINLTAPAGKTTARKLLAKPTSRVDDSGETNAAGADAVIAEGSAQRLADIEKRLTELLSVDQMSHGLTPEQTEEFQQLQKEAQRLGDHANGSTGPASGGASASNLKAKEAWNKIFMGSQQGRVADRKSTGSKTRSKLIPVIPAGGSTGTMVSPEPAVSNTGEADEPISEQHKRLKEAQQQVREQAQQAARLQAHFDAKVQASSQQRGNEATNDVGYVAATQSDRSSASIDSTTQESAAIVNLVKEETVEMSPKSASATPLVRATTKPGPIPGTASVRVGIPNHKTRSNHVPEDHYRKIRLYLRQQQQMEDEQQRDIRTMEVQHRLELEHLLRQPNKGEEHRNQLRQKQQREHDELLITHRRNLEKLEEQQPPGVLMPPGRSRANSTASSAGAPAVAPQGSTPPTSAPVATPTQAPLSVNPMPLGTPTGQTNAPPSTVPPVPPPSATVPQFMHNASGSTNTMPPLPPPGLPQPGYLGIGDGQQPALLPPGYPPDASRGFQWTVQHTAFGPMMFAVPVQAQYQVMGQPPLMAPHFQPAYAIPPAHTDPQSTDAYRMYMAVQQPLHPFGQQPYYPPNPFVPGPMYMPAPAPPYLPTSTSAPPGAPGSFNPAPGLASMPPSYPNAHPHLVVPPGLQAQPVPSTQAGPSALPPQQIQPTEPAVVPHTANSIPAEPVPVGQSQSQTVEQSQKEVTTQDSSAQPPPLPEVVSHPTAIVLTDKSETVPSQPVVPASSTYIPVNPPMAMHNEGDNMKSEAKDPAEAEQNTVSQSTTQGTMNGDPKPNLELSGEVHRNDPAIEVGEDDTVKALKHEGIDAPTTERLPDASISTENQQRTKNVPIAMKPEKVETPEFEHVRDQEEPLSPLELLDIFEHKNYILSPSQWRFYDTPAELDQLMRYLITTGGRERRLVAALQSAEPILKKSMEKRMAALNLQG